MRQTGSISLRGVLTPNEKGNLAEAAIVFHFARLGAPVFRPLSEHSPFDLVVSLGGGLLRIQSKWGRLSDDESIVEVPLTRSRQTPAGAVRRPYGKDEIDAVVAYCDGLDECYLIPAAIACNRRSLTLRLSASGNGQQASIKWAADYSLPGAIAQLGERSAGSRKVVGSNPTSSTF